MFLSGDLVNYAHGERNNDPNDEEFPQLAKNTLTSGRVQGAERELVVGAWGESVCEAWAV